MNITHDNYYKIIESMDISTLPETLQKGHRAVEKITINNTTWTKYHNSDAIKRVADLYFQKLSDYLTANPSTSKGESTVKTETRQPNPSEGEPNNERASNDQPSPVTKNKTISTRKLNAIKKLAVEKYAFDFTENFTVEELTELVDGQTAKQFVEWYGKKYDLQPTPEPFEQPTKSGSKGKSNSSKSSTKTSSSKKVEFIEPTLKLIRRYVNMHNKVKTSKQIRAFVNTIQKLFITKQIRKATRFAKEIDQIQRQLINWFEKSEKKGKVTVEIDDKYYSKYLSLIGREEELPSVRLLKSYVNLQGKLITNDQAKRLYTRITSAIDKGKITKRDKYSQQIEHALETLYTFIKKNDIQGMIEITPGELNGLAGIAWCNVKRSIDNKQQIIMKSTDLQGIDFDTYEFHGKWKTLIGNPSKGFSGMISAPPKMGKSYEMIEFAGYLARHHGPVLYVAKEEGMSETLKEKLRETKAAHPDMHVSNFLPDDLHRWEFVFLDSVTKLGLSPEDLIKLEANYPEISFMKIFQQTKAGKHKGSNEHLHDVDFYLTIPRPGLITARGRFTPAAEYHYQYNQAA